MGMKQQAHEVSDPGNETPTRPESGDGASRRAQDAYPAVSGTRGACSSPPAADW
jgi:hypothetical protein